MSNDSWKWFTPILMITTIVGFAWYLWNSSDDLDFKILKQSQPSQRETSISKPVTPQYPIPQLMDTILDNEDLKILPPLDQSDSYFILAIESILGKEIADLLSETTLIEKIVATVDNLPNKHVAERIRPIAGVKEQFLVATQSTTNGKYILDLENFKRYDFLINLLSQSNLGEMVELYKRFYPLFQEAYIGLGYPQRYFNDRVIEVIDHLVETPEIEETIALIRPHVLYEFADPNLEKLSSGQKILIRMGNENALKAKKFLGELRKLLISNSD